jgi:hypothetical protein
VNSAERYTGVVKAFVGKRGVSASPLPAGERARERGVSFGSSALKIDNRIFAMLASGDRFVVKLPRQRVDALIAAGEGQPFEPRNDGRLMKEWLVVRPGLEARWLPLAQEAFEFGKTKRA